MRIEKLETFIAENWMFVRLTTDNGLQGVGESTFFGWPQAAESVAKSFAEYLIGQDPLPVEQHWLYMFRNKNMRGMAIGGAKPSGRIAIKRGQLGQPPAERTPRPRAGARVFRLVFGSKSHRPLDGSAGGSVSLEYFPRARNRFCSRPVRARAGPTEPTGCARPAVPATPGRRKAGAPDRSAGSADRRDSAPGRRSPPPPGS